MLNSKYQRYADRLESLVDEGNRVANLAQSMGSPDPRSLIKGKDKQTLRSWLVKAENLLQSAFGKESAHYSEFTSLKGGTVNRQDQVYRLIGVLEGALDDLRGGYLIGQEFLVAGEVFDSVLERARHLHENQYHNPAAVLGRVVLEDALQRLAREEGIDPNQKTNQINIGLRKADRYPKPQWRRIESWLDVGNAAAHGNFDEFTAADVEDLLDGVAEFIATELRP